MLTSFFTDHKIPYEVRKTSRSKRHKIVIFPTYIELVVPALSSKKQLDLFLKQQQKWIIKNWQKHGNKTYDYSLPEQYEQGCKLPFLGKLYKLVISRTDCLVARLLFENEQFILHYPLYLQEPDYTPIITKLYQQFLQQHLLEIVESKLEDLSLQIDLKVNILRLRKQKSRFGSCSSKGNININSNLIFAPQPVIEYVVIHEFCHLRHQHHGPEFWQMVKSLCPDYTEHKKWLKNNSHIVDFEIKG